MTTLFTAELPEWKVLPLFAAALIAAAAPANAQTVKEPTWPQQFQVLQGENASFGFLVTQPGPIKVDVTTQTGQVQVELLGPTAQSLRKTGSGTLEITYTATAADVQKSPIWLVVISEANPTQPAAGHPPQVVATGSIRVTHPPSTGPIAQSALKSHVAAAPKRPVMKGAAMPASASALMASYQKQRAAQQEAQKLALERRLQATGAPMAMKSSTRPPIKMTLGPHIDSMNITHGQPGDWLLIYGSGFGTAGEAHVVVNPHMDVKAPQNVWTDTKILTSVPAVTGIGGYVGKIYVQSAGKQSAAVRFDFQPDTDWFDLTPVETMDDAHVDKTDLAPVCGDRGVCRDGSLDFWGHKGDDIFYGTTTLKNGWIVHEVNAGPFDVNGFSAGAYPVDSRVGTIYPYAKVHWWMDSFTSFNYAVVIIIKGPKGTTYYCPVAGQSC